MGIPGLIALFVLYPNEILVIGCLRTRLFQVAVVKFLGKTVLRLAEATVLPFNTTQYTHHLDWYIDKYVGFILTTHLQNLLTRMPHQGRIVSRGGRYRC
jgi:hypothetical protein